MLQFGASLITVMLLESSISHQCSQRPYIVQVSHMTIVIYYHHILSQRPLIIHEKRIAIPNRLTNKEVRRKIGFQTGKTKLIFEDRLSHETFKQGRLIIVDITLKLVRLVNKVKKIFWTKSFLDGFHKTTYILSTIIA